METVKEKLANLISEIIELYPSEYEKIVTYLIQNGVTIATDNNVGDKWVKTSERKPTKEDADKLGRVIAYTDMTGIILTIPWYDVVPEIYSHWTATPQPPKGVQ